MIRTTRLTSGELKKMAAATVLFLNLTGACFAFGRRFFLKNTGRKLAHFDRELNAGRAPMPPHLHGEELS
jgi:hypothetical protein